MIVCFVKLGYDLCLMHHGMTKTAQSWVPPLAGAGLGALLGPKWLPAIGAENQRVNPALGALIGATAALGGEEIWRVISNLRKLHASFAPIYKQNIMENLRKLDEVALRNMNPPMP